MTRPKHLLVIAMLSGTVAAEAAGDGFAVVELFTSEGCSSCPPADKVFSDLRQSADERTILLAWHVDYWNYLGWDDRFSEAAHSARQREAAADLGSSVYTPQTIVNGTAQFVGSDASKTRGAVEKARSANPAATVTASAARGEDGKFLEISYRVQPAPNVRLAPGLRLDVVLTEDGLTSKVAKGENGGRTLQHDAVVRAASTETLPTSMEGTSRLAIPQGVNFEKAHLILLLRGKDSYAVLGAASVPLGSLGGG